jgi:hypothetical protein
MARNVRVVTGPAYAPQDRAEAFADALTARALRSRAPQQGGPVQVAMNPWEGVAQMGEAGIAALLSRRAQKLAGADQERKLAANDQMIRQLAGTKTEDRAPMATYGQQVPNDERVQALSAAMAGKTPEESNQILSGQVLQNTLAKPKFERVDLGDSIGVVDESGNVVQRIPKGYTPDAALRESGENSRYDRASGNARLGAQTTMRGQDIGAQTQMRGQDMTYGSTIRGQDMSAETARRGQDITRATAQGTQDAATAAKNAANTQTWDMYRTARAGLLGGLEGTSTGPVAGRMPAITSAQQTADGGVSAMAPVLKQLFRIAGEGTFTDRDQALLLMMVPSRTDLPDARDAKIANIDRIVRAKLGVPEDASADLSPQSGAAPAPASASPDIYNYMLQYGGAR